MIALAWMLACTDSLTVRLNGADLPCHPGEINSYPRREIRIGGVLVRGAGLKQYPDLVVVTGVVDLNRSGFE